MQKEKVRIYALARELNMESKDLLDVCRQHGIDVKNQLSSLEPEQRDAIVQLVQRGGTATATATKPAPRTAPPPPIRNLPSRPPVLPSHHGRRPAEAAPEVKAPPPAPTPPAPTPPGAAAPAAAAEKPAAAPVPPAPPAAPAAQVPGAPATPAPAPRPPEGTAPAAKAPEQPPVPKVPETPAARRPAEQPTARAPEAPPTPPTPAAPRAPLTHLPRGQMRDLNAQRGDVGRSRRDRVPPRPGGSMAPRVAPPPAPKVKPPEKKETAQPAGPKKLMDIPAELQNREGPVKIEDLITRHQAPAAKVPVVPVTEEDEEEGAEDKGKGKKRPGGVVGRDARHKERNLRQEKRRQEESRGGRLATAVEEDVPRTRIRPGKRKHQPGTLPPKEKKVTVELPVTVRSLSEALGIQKGQLLFRLMGHGAAPTININSTIEPDLAETVALELGRELDIKRPQDAEEQLLADLHRPDNPEDLVLRAPVVTIMGHVDHGKTSLLDKIRRSNVVATEAGGITQVIRAWRVEHDGKPITFLDTPGHEAFTKMRARGANVTDIAVIVVAADDGVMPQTEEAISHAKAAGVSIIVALNKIDLPNANVRRAEQQLYGLGLIPDNMGGDVPFVYTSAASGQGIDELLEQITVVSEYARELRANPRRPGSGTCLEANLSEGEGVLATLLVQNGTLHRGDVIVCGAAYGRVRALYDDLGRHIEEAGPSVPVCLTGLDEVPNADDPFVVVPDLATAREVAAKRKARQLDAALVRRAPVTLENLSEAKIAELKVILKAEARGSIEAIRKEIEKLQHAEVRVRVLHTAIGGITVSDVQLALTSPEDTLILGFNVVPDDAARALAEERGVQVRQYNIIYQLTDDIRAALEGKLKPREEVVHLGRAVVRETFKISRVGTIAGCYVTQGVLERSAKVRVIRNGVVVYPPPDRSVGLESLKRFKEDVREVREGFECGLKVAGYDDIKVDDVIEAYRIEQVQRTLS